MANTVHTICNILSNISYLLTVKRVLSEAIENN